MKLLLALLLICSTSPVFACLGKLVPESGFEKYDSIVVGEVVGVRMSAYIEQRLDSISKGDRYQRRFSDVTPEYELELLVDRTISGEEKSIVKVRASGCGVLVPDLGEFAVALITDSKAFPVFQSEGALYSDLLIAVAKWSRGRANAN